MNFLFNSENFTDGPFFVQEMPLNEKGGGPVPKEEAVEILYQVWDATTFECVFEGHDEDWSNEVCAYLNSDFKWKEKEAEKVTRGSDS